MAGHSKVIRRTNKPRVGLNPKTRFSDHKKITKLNPNLAERQTFRKMVKREFKAVTSRSLSRRLARCFYHKFHYYPGEQYLSILDVLKEAYAKKRSNKPEIKKYIDKYQKKYDKWLENNRTILTRRRIR